MKYARGMRVHHAGLGPGVIDFVIHRVLYAPSLTEPIPVGVEVAAVVVTHDADAGTWKHNDGTIELDT